MFNVISIFRENYYIDNKNKILNYCRNAFLEKDEPSHVNMYSSDWENDVASLPYLIYCSNRFKNGNGDMFALLDQDNNICALSGVNISDFDRNVALAGVRTWLNKKLRGEFFIGRYLLPEHLSWAKSQHLKTVALTLNDYNKRLLPYFKRSGIGIRKNRIPTSMFYNGQFHVDFPVIINYTKQWVIYHKIDEQYEPNWESIRFV